MRIAVHERRGMDLGACTADRHILDGLPIAICRLARIPSRRVLRAEAAYGYGAAKREYYYGLKGSLLMDLRGVAVGMTLTAANVDDRDAAYDLLQAIEGSVLGDKGSIRPPFKADCAALGIDLQTPVRLNMKESRSRWWLKLLQRVRKRVETVISPFELRFGLAKTRARDTWHLTNPVTRKLLAPYPGCLAQSPPRSRASGPRRFDGRLTVKVAHRVA